MTDKEHFKRLNAYFTKSKLTYNFFLWGSKHFGFYPKNVKVSEKAAQTLMQDLIGKKLNLNGSMKILDAGCGQGVVSTYLAKKFNCSIVGTTILAFEIKLANKLAKYLGLSNKVTYSLMDYSNMRFENKTFDAIYTIESLCHSPNIRKTLGEFYRVLRKGGKIALFEYRIADDSKFSSYEISVLNDVIDITASPSLREFRDGKLKEIVREAGFRKIEEQDITENFLPSLKRLRDFVYVPYGIVKFLKLQKYFPNFMIVVEGYKVAKRGLVNYIILTAAKK